MYRFSAPAPVNRQTGSFSETGKKSRLLAGFREIQK
jgi:hypothetical protein